MRVIIGLMLLMPLGCQREDGERLARIGRLTGEKIRDAAPARNPFGEIAPDRSALSRVRHRIKSDSYLVQCPIDIVEEADGIHLRGQVPTSEHADLAYRLATTTVGAPHIVNELSVAGK